MIALYIILSIVLLIFILLHFSIVASIKLSNEKTDISVKYLFFTIYPLSKKEKRSKPKNKKIKKLEKELKKEKAKYEEALKKTELLNEDEAEKTKNAGTEEELLNSQDDENIIPENENQDDKKDTKSKLEDLKKKWETIKPYIPLGKKTVKKLLKSIRITNLFLKLDVANEDAYECAMNYGKVNMAVYNGMAILTKIFTVSITKICISSKFNSSETEYDLSCKIKTRPSTLIALAVSILLKFLYTNIKIKIKEKKEKNKQMKETEMLKNE